MKEQSEIDTAQIVKDFFLGDIMEYIGDHEKYVEMDRIWMEEKSDVVERFLVETFGTNKFDPDEFYIFRWFLNNYKDKFENGNRKQYKEIIEVFVDKDYNLW